MSTSALSGAGDDEAVAPVLGGAAVTADVVVGTLTSVTERAVMCADGEMRHDWYSRLLESFPPASVLRDANNMICAPHHVYDREVIVTAWTLVQ